MSPSIESSNEQNMNSVQYTMSRDHHTNETQGELKGNLHWSQGGLSRSSPLRSDGSWDSQAGRLDHECFDQKNSSGPSGSSPLRSDGYCDGQAQRLDRVSGGQRHSKLSKISRGTTRLKSTRSDGSHGSQAGKLDCMSSGQILSDESQKNDFKQPSDPLKWTEWHPNKKTALTLSQGTLKGWDVENEADDEVRTTVLSQIRVTATLITDEPFVWPSINSSPLVSASEPRGGGGQEIDGQRDTNWWLYLDFQLLHRPPYNEQGLQSLQ